MNHITSEKLTFRYSLHQFLFFAVCAGISGFGVTYLLDQGFSASQAGTILSVSSVLSCLIQPLLGDLFDRLKTFMLPQIVGLIFIAAFCSFALMQIVKPPFLIYGLLYGAGNFLFGMTNSLSSSICAYYANRGYAVNYGVGQGLGSLAFSFCSLAYGYIIAALGTESMIWIMLCLIVMASLVVFRYPKLNQNRMVDQKKETLDERVSLWVFFGKYKGFTITLFGVLLVGMCHTMSENYFIAIFRNLGGDAQNVGVAFFISCLSSAPFFIFFEKIQKKVDILFFLKTAGLFFLLKTFLLIIATEVWHVYLIQLLQTFTYGFINQPLYYFARQRVSQADLVKGQAVAASMYVFGTACGGFAGGRALDAFGLDKMLSIAFVVALTGTIIINVSLFKDKREGLKSGN